MHFLEHRARKNAQLISLTYLEILKQGRDAIAEYFRSLEGEEQALNEVKVLLIGDGGAGKTSLVKRMLGERFDKYELQTHGIKIKHWIVEKGETNVRVHFWDFGGQEIMHATHQFFLSKRSLYILVLDCRKDQKVEYWLKHIESFGGNSPILVVINKIDENPAFDLNRVFLQNKYKGVKGFYRTSCAKNTGIKPFVKRLTDELTAVELIQTTWPKSWFNVKTRLEHMADHFISYEQYEALCDQEGVEGEVSRDTLVDFLHDLGVILHFREFELEDTHVLDPKWVTEAVYKIINSEKLAKTNGVLKLNALKSILVKKREDDYAYPRSRYKYIIGLMKKFELCYEIDDKTVLIPDLLGIQEPEFEFDYDAAMKFMISFDFFPRSVMPRFIVKMNKDIKGKLRWRTGVVLEDEALASVAVVRADYEAKKIYIYVKGKQKKDYFAAILYFFREIINSFEKIKAIEQVPMPDEPDVTCSYKHLLTLSEKGIEAFIPDGSEKLYRVQELLGMVQFEKKGDEEILEVLRRIEDKITDEASFVEEANKIIDLRPNILGFGINLNQLAKKYLDRKKKRGG